MLYGGSKTTRFRCPYQANVMKMLELVKRIMVCMASFYEERIAKGASVSDQLPRLACSKFENCPVSYIEEMASDDIFLLPLIASRKADHICKQVNKRNLGDD